MIQCKIYKTDRDAIARICAEWSIQAEFFTVESNENLLLLQIPISDPGTAFLLGKYAGHSIELDAMR
jgi:hypothetical protein